MASRATAGRLAGVADACVCLLTPEPFLGVGHWYDDFSQPTDEELCALLEDAANVTEAGVPAV